MQHGAALARVNFAARNAAQLQESVVHGSVQVASDHRRLGQRVLQQPLAQRRRLLRARPHDVLEKQAVMQRHFCAAVHKRGNFEEADHLGQPPVTHVRAALLLQPASQVGYGSLHGGGHGNAGGAVSHLAAEKQSRQRWVLHRRCARAS